MKAKLGVMKLFIFWEEGGVPGTEGKNILAKAGASTPLVRIIFFFWVERERERKRERKR